MAIKNPKGFAIASLVMGILSLVFSTFFVFGILAIVFGAIGMKHLPKEPKSGRGMAIAGLVMGIVSFVLLIMLLGALAYFGVLDPTRFTPPPTI